MREYHKNINVNKVPLLNPIIRTKPLTEALMCGQIGDKGGKYYDPVGPVCGVSSDQKLSCNWEGILKVTQYSKPDYLLSIQDNIGSLI